MWENGGSAWELDFAGRVKEILGEVKLIIFGVIGRIF